MTAVAGAERLAGAGDRRVRPGAALAWTFLALVAVAALWPSLLAGHQPNAVDPAHALAGPGSGHPFGTDQLGRDILSRIVYGTRASVTIGLGATAFAVVAGSVLSTLAALGGRAADELVMRTTDVFLAFPGLLLAMLVVAVLGGSTLNATLAIGMSSAPGFARLIRGQMLVIRESDYVQAARALGRRPLDIHLRHTLPNALPPVLVLATVQVGAAIIGGSSLSFLGLGPKPPTAEWGAMLAEGRSFLAADWAVAVFPGLVLTATVVACNVAGRSLRRRFEGRRHVDL
ncbi:ABC transporter permease [Actinomadura decatromicini]|uniref:ABC transporter permease n=1 Tax=Actinomadura decatromicini TaxID=2604572 RepID=A0A5D3FXP3_9ACTN|nr:ABC transporter permease [Actinomadura decatromicini]TYK52470.1 ABC transporter permease [Actinomadura decatromicini]